MASNFELENFAAVEDEAVEKHLVVFQQSREEAEEFVNSLHPEAGLHVHSCGDAGFSPTRAGRFWRLRRLLEDLQPDVVHANHTETAVAAAVLRTVSRFRLLVTAHSHFERYSWGQKIGFLLAFLSADRIACNSASTLESLPAVIGKGKRQVIYNGVDFDQLDRYAVYASQAKPGLRIGTMCRMVEVKDLETLIRAFAAVAFEPGMKEAELRLVGDGPERGRLEAVTEKLGLSNRVRFTGSLPRRQAYRELAGFDIFVVSSRWEGFCNAMVEAAGAGKPVVATNIKPLVEVIGNDNALFFDAGEIEGLARLLRQLAGDPELRDRLGQSAGDRVRTRYPLQKSAREYARTYWQLGNR